MGQGELWPEIRDEEVRESLAANWYLFVYADGDDVRAELSYPKAIEGDQFQGFNERIILVQKDEWQTVDVLPDDVPLPEPEVSVTRKGK